MNLASTKIDPTYRDYLYHAISFTAIKDAGLHANDDQHLLNQVTESELKQLLSKDVSSRLFAKDGQKSSKQLKLVNIRKVEDRLEKMLHKVVELLGCKTADEAIRFLSETMKFNSSANQMLAELNANEIEVNRQVEQIKNEVSPELIQMKASLNEAQISAELDCKLAIKRSEALKLRSELLECEIVSELYGEQKVQALQQISNHLEREIKRTESELKCMQKTLSQYEVLGPDFHDIVKQYKEVRRLVESNEFVLYGIDDETFAR